MNAVEQRLRQLFETFQRRPLTSEEESERRESRKYVQQRDRAFARILNLMPLAIAKCVLCWKQPGLHRRCE